MAQPHLPPAVCWDIFVLLPAQCLIRFRAVCKAWRSVIDDFFVKAHIDKQQLSSKTLIIRASTGPPFSPLYSLDLDALNFTDGLQSITVTPLDFTPSGLAHLPVLPVAQCNGLMLVAPSLNPQGTSWEIWNPLTQERLNLPQIWGNNPNSISRGVLGVGIGYDCAADDYKAVVVIDNRRQTYVCSLKLDSWKDVGSCPFAFEYLSDDNRHGVFLNGSLHWVSNDMVIVFNVVTENYSQLPLPGFTRRPGSMHLDALSGCLFLSYFFQNADYKTSFVVWVMNEYDSWMKLFKLETLLCPVLKI